jgi:type II secretory pathway component PulK
MSAFSPIRIADRLRCVIRTAAPSRGRLRNERGIALLVVLVVVALLTITVTEFAFNVQIDMHRTRNAANAMQAALLARSGINIMEGYVVLDRNGDDGTGGSPRAGTQTGTQSGGAATGGAGTGAVVDERNVTWYGEDWWVQLNEFCKGLQLDENMRIRCKVRDESGKINVNLTNPKSTTQPRTPPRQPAQTGQTGQTGQDQDPNVSSDAVVRDALRCIFERRGINLDIVDNLPSYWEQDQGTRSDGSAVPVAEFSSLEDFAARFGIPTEQAITLRNVLTAMPLRGARLSAGGRNTVSKVNINTAPVEVLAAILNPEEKCQPDDAVNWVIEHRSNGEPVKAEQITPKPEKNWAAKSLLLGSDSNFFRLEASAQTNLDPDHPEFGGIGQTLSELVKRKPRTPTAGGSSFAEGEPRWTLETLDWHKEGGARLFYEPTQDDAESADAMNEDEEGAGQPTPNY